MPSNKKQAVYYQDMVQHQKVGVATVWHADIYVVVVIVIAVVVLTLTYRYNTMQPALTGQAATTLADHNKEKRETAIRGYTSSTFKPFGCIVKIRPRAAFPCASTGS